jgi:hypothetical protein
MYITDLNNNEVYVLCCKISEYISALNLKVRRVEKNKKKDKVLGKWKVFR